MRLKAVMKGRKATEVGFLGQDDSLQCIERLLDPVVIVVISPESVSEGLQPILLAFLITQDSGPLCQREKHSLFAINGGG
jgi:hypothetical protein